MQSVLRSVNLAVEAIEEGDLDTSIRLLTKILLCGENDNSVPCFGSVADDIMNYNKAAFRYNFEEGMFIYMNPVKISCHVKITVESMLPIVYFNLGITHVFGRQDNDALVCFKHCFNCNHRTSCLDDAEILCNLGHIYYRRKDYAQSKMYYADALSYARQVHGECHLDYALILNCLGVVCSHLNPLKSLKYLREALLIRKTILPDVNCDPDTATLVNNLGRVHFILHDYTSSIFNFEMAHNFRSSLYEDQSPEVAIIEFNLARANQESGNTLTALYLFQRALSKLRKDSSIAVECLLLLASIFEERKEYNNALHEYSEALIVASKASDDIAYNKSSLIHSKIGDIYCELKDWDIALKNYMSSLCFSRRLSSCDNVHICTTLMKISGVYQALGIFTMTLKFLNEALSIKTPNSYDTTGIYLAIGSCHRHLGSYHLAVLYYEMALFVKMQLVGGNHYDCSSILNVIGVMCHKQGNLYAALKAFTCSVYIRRNCQCEREDMAVVLFNKACINWELCNSSEAIQGFREALFEAFGQIATKHNDNELSFAAMASLCYKFRNRDEVLDFPLNNLLAEVDSSSWDIILDVIESIRTNRHGLNELYDPFAPAA